MTKITVQSSIKQASQSIDRLDAELLMAFVLSQSRTWVIAHGEKGLTPAQQRRFQALVTRRVAHEPVAYLIGETSFYSRPFFTDKRALVPRPETEDLVARALEVLQREPEAWQVWDVGTGSGAIAVTLKACLPALEVFASDVDRTALQLAKKNAKRHAADIKCIEANLLDEAMNKRLRTSKRSHLFVTANLPYLPLSDKKTLMPDVRLYEPHQALFAKHEGMDLMIRLMSQLATWAKQDKRPWVALFEFDPAQATQLQKKAQKLFPQAQVRILKDMYKRKRFLEITQDCM